MASSSSSRRYDVFPSFSGEDVRKSFLSHLLKELDRKSINTFIDNGIERSRPIGPELISAIRDSRISIVIFSKNYASSTWCLNELVEIHKCYMELDQMVIPIFYNVDPSEVRKQTGEFGKLFGKTCCKGITEDQKQKWTQALAQVANMAGEDLRNWCNEANMIEKIAEDVSNKVITPSNCYGDLVGVEAHLEAMSSILCLESKESRMVGILGPSGIGKSTIGRALFSQLSSHFHHRAFVTYKRTNQDDYGMKLCWQENFLSEILDQKDLKIYQLGAVEQRLKLKKVLIILDDVDDIELLKTLVGQTGWFGPGSRIVVITQDRQLLKAHEIDLIYEVKFPSKDVALKMLCQSAFWQNSPPNGFRELSIEAAKLAGNLPLGLSVLGSSLRRKDQKEWEEMLPRLQNGLDGKIEKVLRVGYDRLDGKDQDLFLFIAFAGLFNGLKISYIRLNDVIDVTISVSDIKCLLGESVTTGLTMLADKSLIRITNKTIEMHNSLQKLAREIGRAESINNPGKRRYLVDVEDIRDVFTDKTGTESVLGIYFNTLEIKEPFSIHEKSFEGMRKLQFLIVRGLPQGRLHLPQGLVYLPRKLRLLKWDGYPSKCLPSKFKAEYLVELRMENSSLEKLWEGTQPLGSLKQLIMNWSTYLRELPDLSYAINLEKVYLDGCKSLVTFPSSIQNLLKLRHLHLENCTELQSFPTLVNLKSLEYLNLKGCSRLRNFPQIYMDSSHGISIEVKDCIWNNNLTGPDYLGCFMRYMPRKIRPEHLVRLTVKGNMLEKLWEGAQPFGSLVSMNVSGSVNLNEFPDLSKATNLKHLELNYCHSLVTVPSTIENLNKLVKLEMKGCARLKTLPNYINLPSLEILDLSWCSSLSSFPRFSTNIRKLYLNNTAIEQVPCWIEYIWSLFELTMCCCKRLKNISPNIFRLKYLVKADFSNCGEVETALSNDTVVAREDKFPSTSLQSKAYIRNYFEFNNCFKLDADARALILRSYVEPTILPGEEVPMYFEHQASGNYVTVNLPRRLLCKNPLEIKACVVVGKGFHSHFRVRWHFVAGEQYWDTILEDQLGYCMRSHLVFLFFKFCPTDRLCLSLSNFDDNAIEFEFSTINPSSAPFSPSVQSIQKCGVTVLDSSPIRHRTKLGFNDVETEYLFNTEYYSYV